METDVRVEMNKQFWRGAFTTPLFIGVAGSCYRVYNDLVGSQFSWQTIFYAAMLCWLGFFLKVVWQEKNFFTELVGEHLERIIKQSEEWKKKAGYD